MKGKMIMKKKILIVISFVILIVLLILLIPLTINAKKIGYQKIVDNRPLTLEEEQRLKEKMKQQPKKVEKLKEIKKSELSRETQNEIEAINKKREQSIKETLEQAEKVLNIMRKYKNKELEDFYKLVGTRDLTKVDVEYAPKFNQIVFDMYRYSNITKEEKAILKEYLADGLDSYNYQTNPKLLEEIEKELNIK